MKPRSSSTNADNASVNEDQAASEDFAFAGRVEEKLKELGRDWAWLSRQTGISTSGLSDMRKKGRIPRADRAIAISKALKVDFEWLATGALESKARLNRTLLGLAPDEERLLKIYGRLSEREQKAVSTMMAMLVGMNAGEVGDASAGAPAIHDPRMPFAHASDDQRD